jgi:lipid-binding SYLF domain-containing protein
MRSLFVSMLVLSFGVMAGCSTAPKTEAKRDALLTNADSAMETFRTTDSSVGTFMNGAHGYAIFPKIGKGGAVAGGAYGRGVLYQGGQMAGYCDVTQATVGAQLGGQTYSELIVFETRDALERFKSGNFAFSANASAVANKEGAAKTAKYENGVAVFVHPTGGLMAEAAIGGQKFNYRTTAYVEDKDTARVD